MRVAAIGHVEEVEFVRVDAPVLAGAIVHGGESWREAAGGGAMASVALARLAGRSVLYTCVGDDEAGRTVAPRLGALGVEVRAASRPGPQRRAITLVDPAGERTIVVYGESPAVRASDPLPYDELASFDAVYVCKADPEVIRACRAARVLVGTARIAAALRASGVRLDALVRSARDPGEADEDVDAALVVATEGSEGGAWRTADARGRWAASPLPGPFQDSYGAGDTFAAALAYGLAAGNAIEGALRLAADEAAEQLCRRGGTGALGG